MRVSLFAVCLLGCQLSPPPAQHCLELQDTAGTAVAQVGQSPITDTRIRNRIARLGMMGKRTAASEKKLRQLVEDEIRMELIVQAALERRLDQDPDVREATRQVMVRRLIATEFEGAELETSDAAVARFYERHKEDYRQPEKRRFVHLKFANSEKGEANAQKYAAKLTDASFSAKEVEALMGKYSGGWEAYRSAAELVDKYGQTFSDTLFSQTPKTWSGPVLSAEGWHTVYLLSVRDSVYRTQEEVAPEIRARLKKNRRTAGFDAFLDEVQTRHPVAVYDERLLELMGQLKKELQ